MTIFRTIAQSESTEGRTLPLTMDILKMCLLDGHELTVEKLPRALNSTDWKHFLHLEVVVLTFWFALIILYFELVP